MSSQPTPKLPRTFGVYQTAHSDLVIAHHQHDPTPLLLFTSRKPSHPVEATTTKYTLSAPSTGTLLATGVATDLDPFYPSLVVLTLSSPNPTSTPSSFTTATPSPAAPNPPPTLTLNMRANQKTLREFTFPVDSEQTLFRWKSSACKAVRELGGSEHGLKLVKVGTGEVVAAWSQNRGGYFSHKKGRMSFVGDSLGEEFEVLVVMGLLALVDLGLHH